VDDSGAVVPSLPNRLSPDPFVDHHFVGKFLRNIYRLIFASPVGNDNLVSGRQLRLQQRKSLPDHFFFIESRNDD